MEGDCKEKIEVKELGGNDKEVEIEMKEKLEGDDKEIEKTRG